MMGGKLNECRHVFLTTNGSQVRPSLVNVTYPGVACGTRISYNGQTDRSKIHQIIIQTKIEGMRPPPLKTAQELIEKVNVPLMSLTSLSSYSPLMSSLIPVAISRMTRLSSSSSSSSAIILCSRLCEELARCRRRWEW